MKLRLTILFCLLATVAWPQSNTVLITEFMAQNTTTLRDEDGDYSDWIELFNPTANDVNLAGWYLTDTRANLVKWRFPATNLPPDGFLVVFASGKFPVRPLHTSFQLGAAGEYLALVQPDGLTIASEFAPVFPPQSNDVSYGLLMAGNRVLTNAPTYLVVPSPGMPNPFGKAPPVRSNHTEGTFITPFDLTLFTESTNAVIRYIVITNLASASGNAVPTNVPTATSPIYTGAIPVTATTQIRARAFEFGKLPGDPVTLSYVQLAENLRGFSSDLPICVLHTLGSGAVSSSGDSAGLFVIFDSDFDRSSLTNQPRLVTRVGVNTRGSSTGGQAKSNFSAEFWDEFNRGTDKPFLDLPADSDWVLYGIDGFDPGLMHNAIFHWFGNQLQKYSSRTRFVEIFYKTGGGPVTTSDYFGLYLVEETPKRHKDRVDIAALSSDDTTGSAVTGGYLLKIDRNEPDDRVYTPPAINGLRTTPAPIEFVYPKVTSATVDPRRLTQINYIQGYIQTFLTNLTAAHYTNELFGYPAYIETDQWVDNLIGNIICFNPDSYRLGGFFFKDRGGKLQQGPFWDCDRCLGTGGTATPQGDNRCFSPRFWRLPANDVNTDNGTDFFGVSNVGVSWFSRLFSDPDFWQKFIDRYQMFRMNQFTTNAIVEMVDGFHAQIKEAQVREQARWAPSGFNYPRAGIQTVNSYTFDFGPNLNAGRGYFSNEVNFQKKWLLDRLNFIDTNFLDMPVLSRGSALVTPGTIVSATPAAKAGTLLLYTLDGTDPRLPGGAVAPAALTNIGPLALTITNSVRLFARSYNPSHANLTNSGTQVGMPILNSFWSGPVAASFYTKVPPLRITEIMYHSAGLADDTNIQDNFEYVEVRNIGAVPLNLDGFTISGGIEFTFPSQILDPGEYAVVVKDVDAFRSRYGTIPRLLGVFGRFLGNNGDRLVLTGSLGEPILDFRYDPAWYPTTDGLGFSLHIVDDTGPPSEWGNKLRWRPSGEFGGSPGRTNSGPFLIPAVVINEILANPAPGSEDAIELFNPGSSEVDVSGWFLTDDFNNPRKFRIPDGTWIDAQGYLAFDEHAFNPFDDPPGSFSFNADGEAVYLFSADAAGNLAGYVHGFRFGVTETNVSLGRHITSIGEEHFVAQSDVTFALPNAGPRVGPIVISEINYHPPDLPTLVGNRNNRIDEYIELQNITEGNVPLFEVNVQTNTWRLRGGIDYQFPMGTVLTGGNYLLVVSFHPTDASQAAEFRSRMGVPAGVPLYGPFSGDLGDEGDNVELARPYLTGQGLGVSTPSYLLVDKVEYKDKEPWPEGADGFGPSLQRISTRAYGDDPANWTAAARTPGGRYVSGALPSITHQPQRAAALAGLSAMFSVTATGPGPLSYFWRFNSSPIIDLPTATNSTLFLPNVQPNQAGIYSCLVLNSSGVAVSDDATLSVLPPARIVMQPQSIQLRGSSNLVDYGNTTNDVTFTVQGTGTGLVSYQWRFNGMTIPGAVGTNLHLTNVQLTNDGLYDALITDDIATISSAGAQLSVLITPVITEAPLPQTVPAGSRLNLSVAIRGNPPPFGYQWRSNSLVFPLIISDSKTNFFSITTATNPSVATYRVVITNAANQGNAVVATFSITTVADTDFDGLPDLLEISLGLDPNNPADALLDLDHDGVSNRDEYIAGTDPTNVASYLKVDHLTVAGSVRIEFLAVSNRTYGVEATSELTGGHWTRVAEVVASATNRLVEVLDPMPATANTQRVYRLVTPRGP